MIRLALLRHGHTAWNRAHKIQGRSDIPLEPDAETALKALKLPDPWAQAEIVSSPMQRAQQTAWAVAQRAPTNVPELTEMSWGDWEGLHGVDLRADPASGYRDLEHWGWDFTPPKGESPQDVRARVDPWLEALTQDTLAVTHIGVMRVILAIAHDWDFKGTCPFTIKRNRLFIVCKDQGAWHPEEAPVRLETRAV